MAKSEKEKARELLDNLRFDQYPLPEERQQNIGSRTVRRLDGVEKASGEANYTMDVQLPGMLYMRFLTSPYPHAAIKSLDTGKAEALPGVRAILRFDDPAVQVEEDLGGHGVPPECPCLVWPISKVKSSGLRWLLTRKISSKRHWG